ncbi:hypothetical protein [Pseudomonas sp. TH31]|uniref:hypothetical protein n=1 Tax=Pseudomonas sp. TH31 TaxID=2796396 RepID=UPI0019119885|nr:hypothetical protein [Pseudomonas sp. TH31]MBK5418392.1 hypothetical protein [Pseudomonas sp. TH31]
MNRSTTRAVSFDLPAIKKSTPGDPAHLEARNKIQMLDKERRLLHLRYKPYAETPIPDGHALTKKCEIRQTNQSLLDDCYKLKVALGNDRSRTIGLDALITACQSL